MTINAQRVKVPGFARAPRSQDPSLILVHSTRGETTMDRQFQATVNWFGNPPDRGGWASAADICIGAQGEVAVFYSDEDGDYTTSHATWSAGFGGVGAPAEWGVDEVAISIELAQPTDDDAYTDACIGAFVEFVRPLLAQYGIPATRVWFNDQRRDWAPPRGLVGHDDTANGKKLWKTDPGKRFPWDRVLTALGASSWEEQSGVARLPQIPVGATAAKVGQVWPVIIHHGATAPQVTRMIDGYAKALGYMQRWFYREVGASFQVGSVTPVDSTKVNGKTLADFTKDPWGMSLSTAEQAGLPVWGENAVVAILVDKLPYTLQGFGGASPDYNTGVLVKDGDALELFARGATGEPHDAAGYGQNIAMMCHELLHAFHANAHEDVDGDNVETEWWAGLAADIAPNNKAALLANSPFFRVAASTPPSGEPGPGPSEDPEPEETPQDPPTPPAAPAGQLTPEQITNLQNVRKALVASQMVLDSLLLAQGVPST